jgi:hypothetical protein
VDVKLILLDALILIARMLIPLLMCRIYCLIHICCFASMMLIKNKGDATSISIV